MGHLTTQFWQRRSGGVNFVRGIPESAQYSYMIGLDPGVFVQKIAQERQDTKLNERKSNKRCVGYY